MKNMFLLVGVMIVGSVAFSNEKIDWGVCKADIKTHCSGEHSDHETHKCLEKAGEKKISKPCQDLNHKLEGKLDSKDEKGHKH